MSRSAIRINMASLAILSMLASTVPQTASGEDFFLVIAGGYSPTGNQVSLENNVRYFQRLIQDKNLTDRPVDIFFADGFAGDRSLQVKDLESVPLSNRLMAEFFGSTRNLGLTYRPHELTKIRGGTTRENIEQWFQETGPKMKKGDRLLLYVSAHGGKSKDRNKPYNTTIYLWNNQTITVNELTEHLDTLPDGVSVVSVMVQCHAGGFSRLVFDQAATKNGASRQNRVGFFATVYDRQAAGCTPEVNEENYREYSTYFWAAIGNRSRTGEPIIAPDYDHNGTISFDEAHAYCLIHSDTIDLPIKTSGEFLRHESEFSKTTDQNLLGKQTAYSDVLDRAGPSDTAVLEGLSNVLKLTGEDRISVARKEGSKRPSRTSRSRGRRNSSGGGSNNSRREFMQLRQKIASDTRKRWPELGNVMNPRAIKILTERSEEFVDAVMSHSKYNRYRELADAQKTNTLSPTERRVKYERFVRIADNVILKANFDQTANDATKAQLERILESESGGLPSHE